MIQKYAGDRIVVDSFANLPTNVASGAKATVLSNGNEYVLRTGVWTLVSQPERIFQVQFLSDNQSITVGDNVFHFPIPYEIDGYHLTRAHAFAMGIRTLAGEESEPTQQSTLITINNATQGLELLLDSIPIAYDGVTSYPEAWARINTSNDVVMVGDIIHVNVTQAYGKHNGLGVILTFKPSTDD